MTRADWLAVAVVAFLLLRGAAPKPWTKPGEFGKRRNREWLAWWMGRPK